MKNSNIKLRLTAMNFLEFAVWGAYLTSMGNYLAGAGLAENIGWFYSVQGIVSLFMPALLGLVAVILGLIALKKGQTKGFAIVGIILGLVGFVLGIIWGIQYIKYIRNVAENVASGFNYY